MRRSVCLRSTFSETPVQVPSILQVYLNPEEDQLCALLDECKERLASEGQHVECRIAGGWVRDKLLGAQGRDIDVALSNIMGVAFAEKFVSTVSSKDLPTKSVTKIERNPEQSKHLETARTKVLGIELDFVNLRSESYSGDSRIPSEIKLGTPLEDALRRDITMNALFYNVHTRSVEDFTGKGLDDLKKGILRTPLSPFETFKDDPLRVLRCIRFASRYGFKMVEEIEHTIENPEIKSAIMSKISRGRIGEELDKMMKGRDPLYSIRLITSLNLPPCLFAVPQIFSETFNSKPASHSMAQAAATILHAFLLSSPSTLNLPDPHPLLLSQLDKDPTLRPRMYLAALLTPYAQITYLPPKKKQPTPTPAVDIILREALKLGLQNHYLDGIPALFAAASILRWVKVGNFSSSNERSRIGALLKTKSVHNANTGSHWTSSLLFSLVQELTQLYDEAIDEIDPDQATQTIERYNNFLSRVEELKLPQSIDDKPLLNGNEVAELLEVKTAGPWMGEVFIRMSEWALDHPGASKQECAAWLKEEYAVGNVDFGEDTRGPIQRPARKNKVLD